MDLYLQHKVVFDEDGLSVNDVRQFPGRVGKQPLKSYQKTIYQSLGIQYSKFHKMDLFCRQGFLAAEALLRAVGEAENGHKVGIFLVNQFSSIDTDTRFLQSYGDDNLASPSLFVYTLPNILIGELAIRHRITGEHAFFIQEDFGPEFIYLYIQSLFESGVLRQAIIGTCEMTDWTASAKMGWLNAKEGPSIKLFDQGAFEDWMTK